MLLLILMMDIWPLFIPVVYSFLYGLRTENKNGQYIFKWLGISYALSVIAWMAALFFLRRWCSIDGGDPCAYPIIDTMLASLYYSILLMFLTLPALYMGVFVKFAVRKLRS